MNDLNFFREKLFNHTLPVKEGLWENIESQLPPQKDDRRFPFFWFILFASALLGGAVMIGLFSKKVEKTPSTLPTPSLTIQTTEKSETTPHLASVSPDIPDFSSSSDPSNLSNSISKSGTNAAKNGFASTSSTHSNLNESYFPDSETNLIHSASLPNSSSVILRTTSFLPLSEVELNSVEIILTDISSLAPDPNCYKFGGTGGLFALSADVFAGPGFSPRTFEDTGSESSIYAEARSATENNQYAWSAGARINLHLRNGLVGSLGLLYEQTGDIFDYTDTLATKSTTVIDSFWAADGTFLYADTNRVLIFGTLIKKIHNTYRHLDLPLLIGYELPMGRSTLMINVGPVFNLTSSHEGQILDPMLHPQYITPGAPMELHAYKTNVGISLYLGAGILFPLTTQISALVEPRFQYRFNPVTLDSYPLKEHRHYAGLNLGIRYHFN